MKVIRLTYLIIIFSNHLAYAQLKRFENFSVSISSGKGFYAGTPFNKSDPRNFKKLDDQNIEVTKSNVFSLGIHLNFYSAKKYYFETGLGFQNNNISYAILHQNNILKYSENFIRNESGFILSPSVGIFKQSKNWLHQVSIGPSLFVYQKITETRWLNFYTSTSIPSYTYNLGKSEYLQLNEVLYIALRSTHVFKIKKHHIGISPQLNVLVLQPKLYILTDNTRGSFILQLTYIPPFIKNSRKPKKIIDNNWITKKDSTNNESIKTFKQSDQYVLFLSAQIGGPGLYYLLNSEIRLLHSKYFRANFTLGHSVLIYDNNGINAITPGLNLSFMKKKWKTQFGLNVISILDEYEKLNTSISFQIARFIEFGKGYSFKFGLASFKTGSNYGGSTPILIWPFISFGKCYQPSDL